MLKLKLNGSKIKCLQDCLLKYKYSYIDYKEKSGESKSWYLSFYSSIIDTLRIFFKYKDYKNGGFDTLKNLFFSKWKSEGYDNKEHEENEKNNSVNIMQNLYNEIQENKDKIENPFGFYTVLINGILEMNVFIHRVDTLENGNYEVIMYKTGKEPANNHYLEYDMDASILQICFENIAEFDGELEKITYYYVRTNNKFSFKISDEQIASVKTKLLESAYLYLMLENKNSEQIKDELFNYITNPEIKYLKNEILNNYEIMGNRNYSCKWCDYFENCESWKNEVHSFKHRYMPSYSYSKISSYKNCPYAWKKSYIDRIPSKPKPYFDFGHAVHSTFEIFYSPKHNVNNDLKTLNELYEYYFSKFQQGYETEEQKQKYYEEGKESVKKYFENHIKDQPQKKAYSVEKYFEIPINGKFLLNGFIDRIDKLEDGTYEVLDYKTEPVMRSPEEIDADEQLSIYYWVLKNVYKLEVSKLSLLMTKFDKKIETRRTSENIKPLFDDMLRTVDEIERKKKNPNDNYYPQKINKYCLGCDFLNECSHKEKILQGNLKSMDYT